MAKTLCNINGEFNDDDQLCTINVGATHDDGVDNVELQCVDDLLTDRHDVSV